VASKLPRNSADRAFVACFEGTQSKKEMGECGIYSLAQNRSNTTSARNVANLGGDRTALRRQKSRASRLPTAVAPEARPMMVGFSYVSTNEGSAVDVNPMKSGRVPGQRGTRPRLCRF
jgi:hypothetical protein